jgi:hypothetical protein
MSRERGSGEFEYRSTMHAPPNKPLKQTAAPRRELYRRPLARGDLPRARSSPPDTSPFPDAAAA